MYQRIVIKLGTSVLTGGTSRLDRAHMVEIVRQCAALHQAGRDVILCTSGAITAGRERLALGGEARPVAKHALEVFEVRAHPQRYMH